VPCVATREKQKNKNISIRLIARGLIKSVPHSNTHKKRPTCTVAHTSLWASKDDRVACHGSNYITLGKTDWARGDTPGSWISSVRRGTKTDQNRTRQIAIGRKHVQRGPNKRVGATDVRWASNMSGCRDTSCSSFLNSNETSPDQTAADCGGPDQKADSYR